MKPFLIISWIYAAAVVASLGYMFATSHETAFCGLPAVVLTMPWSLLFPPIAQAVFPRIFDSSLIPGTLLILASALMNFFLIRLLPGKTK